MQSLLYFLLWAGLFFVMMRFGCGAHVMGHGPGHDYGGTGTPGTGTNLGGKALEEDKDPVCGMTVKTASAKSSFYNGLAYFFCSTTCRDKFEAAPSTYAKASSASPNAKEYRHAS